MGKTCYALLCKNRMGVRNINKSFFRVPAANAKCVGQRLGLWWRRRHLWLSRLRPGQEIFPKDLWVCEDHFVTGHPSTVDDVNHPDCAPSLRLGSDTEVIEVVSRSEEDPSLVTMVEAHYNLAEPNITDTQAVDLVVSNQEDDPNPVVLVDAQNDLNEPNITGAQRVEVGKDITESSVTDVQFEELLSDKVITGTQTVLFDEEHFHTQSTGTHFVRDRGVQVGVTVRSVGTQCDRSDETMREGQPFSLDETVCEAISSSVDTKSEYILSEKAFKKDDSLVKFYTGLPNYGVLLVILNIVAPHLPMNNRSILTAFQQVVLTLMKLRLNLFFRDLAYRFCVSNQTVSRTFFKVIEVMYWRLKRNVYWPDRDIIRMNMPPDFKEAFGTSVTVIVGCFEVFIERASNYKALAQTFSHYKHHQTLKYLIGITPQGFVCFLSKGYGGRASDKFVTENCGFLNHLDPGDVIMADRGFLIQDSVQFFCARVIMPAFTKGLEQMSPVDIENTRKIANVRIHVERVIGNLRQKYRILSSSLPISLLDTQSDAGMDEIVTVCGSLLNFCPSVVPVA